MFSCAREECRRASAVVRLHSTTLPRCCLRQTEKGLGIGHTKLVLTWLNNEELLHRVEFRCDSTVVLVAPDDDVEKFVQELFGNVVLRAVSDTILMDDENVEPVVRLIRWSKEIDLILEKYAMQTFVANGSETVDGQIRLTFAKEQRMNVDVLQSR